MRFSKKLKRGTAIFLSMALACTGISFAGQAQEGETVFFDDFNEETLDSKKWIIAEKAWGGNNGGVVPENVSVSDGVLRLEGHGDQYEGNLAGIHKPDGKRTGAAIATREYFGSGSYEVVAKVAPELGACSAIWTFEYEEYYPGDPVFEEMAPEGAEYYVVNHEIDIEIPGRPDSAYKDIGFDYALCNTWRGERGNEYTTNYTKLASPQNDGKFHTYRFDWHTGDKGEIPRVEFYIDGVLEQTCVTHIPTNAGRLWIGLWFPNGWAGTPDFDTTVFEIDSVKITPFHESGDTPHNETYGEDGWAEGSFEDGEQEETESETESENPHSQLLVNGDFAQGEKGWITAGGTEIREHMALMASGADTDSLMQTVIVKPGTTYTLSADVDTPGCILDFGVRDYNGRYTELKKSVSQSGKQILTFTTAKHIDSITVFAEVLRYQENEKTAWITNFFLTEGDNPSDEVSLTKKAR